MQILDIERKNRKHSAQKRFGLYMITAFFIAGVLLVACEMYDARGFNDAGIHRDTETRYDPNGYDKAGYAGNGYNKDGYDKNGFDAGGYNADGYDKNGFDAGGFNADGYDANGFDKNGFKADGYNAAGFDAMGNYRDGTKYGDDGYDVNGYDINGFNAEGYDSRGYDKNGFNAEGKYRDTGTAYNLDGFTIAGIHRVTKMDYDPSGFKIDGYNDAGVYRDDFPTLDAANTSPVSIWSNGETMWLSDLSDNIYAYKMSDKSRDMAKDIDTSGETNTQVGIWSDGTTMWVISAYPLNIYAYHLTDSAATASATDTHGYGDYVANSAISLASENASPSDPWSDGETMWVGNNSAANPKIYAYTMSNGMRDSSKDIPTLGQTPRGLWSNGETMWVANSNNISAYKMSDNSRDPDKDFNTGITGNLYGLYSDDTARMWAVDFANDKIYAYDLATRARPLREE